MRALVLAAGLGTRLRPLTESLPKPLLPVALAGASGEHARVSTVAGVALEALARAGCSAIALNLHHLPQQIPAHFGREQFGVPLLYSHEAEILGTLGALDPLRDFLAADESFLLVNGDSLCNWPLEGMLAHHQQSGADATLLVLPQAPDARLGGGLGLGDHGDVVQLRQMPARGKVAMRRDFAGCHVISRRLLRDVPPGQGDIIAGLYQQVLERGGRIESFRLEGPWHDLGTPPRYLEATAAGGTAISGMAAIAPSAEIRSSVLAAEARVGPNADIESCVACEGAEIGQGVRLRRVILGPGAKVAAGSELSNAIVLRGKEPGEDQVFQLEMS